MRSILIFLFGAGCGVGGTMLYLHKKIKKELADMRIELNEVPFDMKGEKKQEKQLEEAEKPAGAAQVNERVNYNNIVDSVENGIKKAAGIPVMPRDEDLGMNTYSEYNAVPVENETDGGFYEIDEDTFLDDKTYTKERLVYYKGDKIMCTESGAKILNPYMLVGGEWENCVGNYAKRTAFIRNTKLGIDYEIYVENGFYTDEYGDEDNLRED